MDALQEFLSRLSAEQAHIFNGLDSLAKIQAYLDSIPYRVEDDNCAPLSVFRDGRAHCFDGALFATAAMRRLGFPPIIVQMLPENDDDHVLAVYQMYGRYGALAKSNYVGLRSREPIYASIRELVMSYFRDYYTFDGNYSLRAYTIPLRLAPLDRSDWMISDEGVQEIVRRLHTIRKVALMTKSMVAALQPIDEISYKAGMAITNLDGVYQPGKSPQKDYGFRLED